MGQIISNSKSLRNYRILLVEDNPDHAEIIVAAINATMPGVIPIIADNESSAMKLLYEINDTNGVLPRLVFLDLYLPKRENGWKVLQNIKKKSSPFSAMPVIVLSSSNNNVDIKETYDFGCTAYTVKPIEYSSWITYFEKIRQHWLETAVLPTKFG